MLCLNWFNKPYLTCLKWLNKSLFYWLIDEMLTLKWLNKPLFDRLIDEMLCLKWLSKPLLTDLLKKCFVWNDWKNPYLTDWLTKSFALKWWKWTIIWLIDWLIDEWWPPLRYTCQPPFQLGWRWRGRPCWGEPSARQFPPPCLARGSSAPPPWHPPAWESRLVTDSSTSIAALQLLHLSIHLEKAVLRHAAAPVAAKIRVSVCSSHP